MRATTQIPGIRCLCLCLIGALGGWIAPILKGENYPAGTLDRSFREGLELSGTAIHAMAVDSAGRILIGGSFTSVDGVPRSNIARLKSDGRLDLSFDPGRGTNLPVYAIVVQDDERILLGGAFTRFDGQTRRYLARLEEDGSLDSSFQYGLGPNHTVQSLALRPNGDILVGGGFFRFSGQSVLQLTNLQTDGKRRETFNENHHQTGRDVTPIHAMIVEDDGRIVVAGGAFSFLGTDREGIARLFPDGQIDPGFRQIQGDEFRVRAVAKQRSGHYIIGGSFTSLDNLSRQRLARLMPSGTLDSDFAGGLGTNNWVETIWVDELDRVVVGGRFSSLGPIWANRLIRLHPDGAHDESFGFGQGADGDIFTIVRCSTGGLLIGGSFRNVQQQNRPLIARLNYEKEMPTETTASAEEVMEVASGAEEIEETTEAAPPPEDIQPTTPARVSATIDPRDLFAEERQTVALHRVRPGDQIERLAAIYSVPEEDIRLVNGLGPEDPLPIGAMIVMEAIDPEEKAALLGEMETARPPSGGTPREGRLPMDETRWIHHRVVAGDTLFRLARQYNTNVAQIRVDNQLSGDLIRVGQTLRIRRTD